MSDAQRRRQLDTIIEKLDKIIEQIMLGAEAAPAAARHQHADGVYRGYSYGWCDGGARCDGSPGPDLESVKGMTRETLEMQDTDVVLGDVVERLHLTGGQSRVLEVTKRHGVVIDVRVLSN